MRKEKYDFADVYFLTRVEFDDPIIKNKCILESDASHIAFVKENLQRHAQELINLLPRRQYEVCLLYSDAQTDQAAYEQIFALDTEKIQGYIFRRALIEKSGSCQPFLAFEGTWEFLCRLAGAVRGCGLLAVPSKYAEEAKELTAEQLDEKAFANAYVLKSHMNVLHKEKILDSVFLQVCQKMRHHGCFMAFQNYLDTFLTNSEQYEKIAVQTAPFLVLKGDDTCMGVLRKFAEDLSQGLVKAGQAVLCIGDDPYQYDELPGHVYKGIVGFQTKALEIDFFRNLSGLKFQFWMDYPLHFKDILRDLPQEYYVLCQDADHAAQIREFYHTPNALQFPPGGISRPWEEGERPYDIVFVGSYFKDEGTKLQGIQKKFYDFMLEHPEWNFEQGYQRMTGCDPGKMNAELFEEEMYELKPACRAVIGHFREKVIARVLDSGYSLHVYGEEWREYGEKRDNLILHPQVTVNESLKELQKARIGLNIMSWHKAGMTERIANIMLSGAVCLSDETVFLREQIRDGEEILLFRLSQLEEIPGMLDTVLGNEEKRREISGKGYEKALREFTWEARARELVVMAENR